MWNCHSWPMDVSNNLSGYCISNLVLVSAFGIYMCIYALVFPYNFLLVDCFKWALIGHIEKQRVHSVLWQFWMGGRGVYHKFYWGKTDFSLYFPISWLFRKGSHWSHWKVKSSLCALAVSNGREGVYRQFYPGKSENLSSRTFRCAHQKGLFAFRKTNKRKGF